MPPLKPHHRQDTRQMGASMGSTHSKQQGLEEGASQHHLQSLSLGNSLSHGIQSCSWTLEWICIPQTPVDTGARARARTHTHTHTHTPHTHTHTHHTHTPVPGRLFPPLHPMWSFSILALTPVLSYRPDPTS
jgi:hypothetical protein